MTLLLLLTLVLDERHCLVEGDAHGVGILGKRHIFLVMQHIGTETACAYHHFLAFEDSYLTGKFEEFKGLVEGDALHALVGGNLCETWFLFVIGRAYLYHRTEAAYLDKHGLARGGLYTHLTLANAVLGTDIHGLLYNGLEGGVEVFHHLCPG